MLKYKLNIQRFAAPTVTFAPINSATKVDFHNPTITVTFSAAVRNTDDSEITDANVVGLLELKKTNDSGAAVPFTATVNEAKTIVTVIPTGDLDPNQAYYLEVKASSFEDDANEAVVTTNATWTTITRPTITFAPLTSATGVTTDQPTITMTFQEAVRNIDDSAIKDADLADMFVFAKTNANGTPVPCTAAINAGKTEITITVTGDLVPNQLYYLGFLAGKVENGDDIVNIAQSATWTTSNLVVAASTVVPFNSIVGKAAVAGDVDGNTLIIPASDEKTVVILHNSGGSDRVVTVKAPVLGNYAKSLTDLTYTLTAGHYAIVNVESAKFADSAKMINIDVAHADVKLVVFHKE